ncbi:carbamate kinase [Halobiforma lacisalsi AJ5]|uniref:Carbamate kinase n=1 Tax=Natronobacterium lacisalsi AJ5 TaxID=358396 RepID=M0LLC5_NATLA|nr:carbamate kinase [Halobiforma lacisalsi]APW98473.1 carbamate kinase [Halobiforma lacisalsi AJ5]EMA33249.1 carbamate kinase [Halobiforma lacisalsi AJ5]
MSYTVVALGGNALLRGGEGSIEDQRETIRETAPHFADLRERGHELVFAHGNGPQVGQLLLQNEESDTAAEKPLDVLGAESQAQIGYLLQQQLREELGETPATVITQTLVDEADPAFDDPTKRIGPFYDEAEAEEKDFPVKQDTNGNGEVGYRRVVPSPQPIEIIESERIQTLVETGKPVISVGGGGVPVVEEGNGLSGVEAVIDKDRAAQVLATDIEADEFLVLTDVEAVYRNFGTDDQERLDQLTVDEAADLLEAGEFGEGSMAPKVEACIEFVENGGERAIITAPETATEALDDETGTTIVPADR